MCSLASENSNNELSIASALLNIRMDRKQVLRLIELYREQSILWDPKYRDSRHKERKDLAWAAIGQELNMLPIDCQRKIENLKSSLRRETMKIRKSHAKGLKEVYESRWFAYEPLKFLLKKNKLYKTETTNVGGSSVVEKLSFYNHTECECRERTEYDTGNERPSEHRVYRHHQSAQPQNMRRAQTRKPCRCPSEFTPRITSEGECHCNCLEDRQNCIKIRRGKGYFSLADRICIQNEECATPGCEFGEYMRRQGKCPRKKDKFDAIANYHTNLNHRYRS